MIAVFGRTILCLLLVGIWPAQAQSTPQEGVEILRLASDGLIAVVADDLDGVTVVLGHQTSGTRLWVATMDPSLVVQWLGDARDVVMSVDSAHDPYLMTPPLPTVTHGKLLFMRMRGRNRTWAETALVLQIHPDSQVMSTVIAQRDAQAFLDVLEGQARVSRWSPPTVGDSLRPLLETPDPPRRVSGPSPQYPRRLRRGGTEGFVWLSFVITSDGHVIRASIEILYASHPAFIVPSRRVITGSRYRPGMVDGRKVPVRVYQTISYRIGSRFD